MGLAGAEQLSAQVQEPASASTPARCTDVEPVEPGEQITAGAELFCLHLLLAVHDLFR